MHSLATREPTIAASASPTGALLANDSFVRMPAARDEQPARPV